MALRRIEIGDLTGGPAVGGEDTDPAASLPPLFRLGAMHPDTPVEVALGLKPGDRLRFGGGGPEIVRRDGVVEGIDLGG
jgi:hypothetical protein